MKLMADAIKRAGSTDGAKIRDALAATKDFPGASGVITIDETATPRSRSSSSRSRRQFKYVARINP
jgi:branched-chain amino acid transport system substrate-binding protein